MPESVPIGDTSRNQKIKVILAIAVPAMMIKRLAFAIIVFLLTNKCT